MSHRTINRRNVLKLIHRAWIFYWRAYIYLRVVKWRCTYFN